MASSGRTVRVWKRLRDDEQIYGLGEKAGRLNKRGRQLGGYNLTMWNSDTYAYEMDTDPIYASVPFYLVLRDLLGLSAISDYRQRRLPVQP